MVILDVREKEEFEAEHIPDSLFCPLSQLDHVAPGILKNIKDSDVTIMCRSGKRAQLALNEIRKMDHQQHRLSVYEGGILRWKAEGKPVKGKTRVLPLMRQVQLAAGLLVLTGVLGHFFVNSSFVYLAGFVGLGLTLAGSTGFCGMALLLQRMPWNQKGDSGKGASCGC